MADVKKNKGNPAFKIDRICGKWCVVQFWPESNPFATPWIVGIYPDAAAAKKKVEELTTACKLGQV